MKHGAIRAYILISGLVFLQSFVIIRMMLSHEKQTAEIPQYYKLHDEDDKSWPEKVVGDPVALFTLVLTAFTGGLYLATRALWNSTEKLVIGAEKTAAMQLQAYLLVEQAQFALRNDDWNSPLELHLIVKNFGNTPASNIALHIEHRIFSDRSSVENLLEFSAKSERKNIAVVGPQHSHYVRLIVGAHARTYWSMALNQTYAVWGRVTYLDVFDKTRTLSFQLNNRINDVMNFSTCSNGNSFTCYGCVDAEVRQK